MSTKHFWYKLLDKYGVPVSGGIINIYESSTTTFLTVFDVNENQLSQPLFADENGIFEFYVRDNFEINNGYSPTQKMKISWSSSLDETITGDIDNMEIFSQIFPIDETIITINEDDTIKRNTISNANAYKWNQHVNNLASIDNLHNTFNVDINESNDSSYNKKVSNKLMYDLFSILASVTNPRVTSTGALINTYEADSWTLSANKYYYSINHNFGASATMLYQIYDDLTNESIMPYKVDFEDENNTTFWKNDNKEVHITISG